MESFFDQLEELFNTLKNDGLNVEWLLNKAHIDRISDILEVIDEYNEKTEKMSKPINNFLKSINSFLIDSRKKIEVNAVGRLTVIRDDGKKCNIDILSSGERQLLVLIANVILNKYTNLSRVIIIDEPEISLHLRWQERFSEEIISINPETQFILATHSPDIVGDLTEKCLRVGA
nr:AAA family ATPase [Dickeya sp. ws52]